MKSGVTVPVRAMQLATGIGAVVPDPPPEPVRSIVVRALAESSVHFPAGTQLTVRRRGSGVPLFWNRLYPGVVKAGACASTRCARTTNIARRTRHTPHSLAGGTVGTIFGS